MPQTGIADWVGVTHQFVSKVQAEIKKKTPVELAPNKSASCNQLHDRTASTEPKEGLARSETVKVKRGDSEYDQKVKVKKVLDSTGMQVPEHLIKYFERANEYRGLIKQIHAVYKVLKDGKESGDQFYRYIDVSRLTADFNNAKHLVKFAMPFAVCRYCGGSENNMECRCCGGSGFVNEGMYKNTPREFK
jgi:hypothetical protein